MSEKPENPPAFPHPEPRNPELSVVAPGMSLRDYFAGQAIIGLADKHQGNDWGLDGKGHAPAVAEKAYRIADAMLAERQKP